MASQTRRPAGARTFSARRARISPPSCGSRRECPSTWWSSTHGSTPRSPAPGSASGSWPRTRWRGARAWAAGGGCFVGAAGEGETEGYDRRSFKLPGRQDELIRRVTAANPKTVVVVNAASPVDLSWTDEVAAVLQCWFGGQEMAAGVTDVLTGGAEPGGRLATTIPVDLRHNPSHDNFPGENGELRYGEGLFMGYRGYEHRGIDPRFAFGHGLGYTTFEIGAPQLSGATFSPGASLTISVPVTNTGNRAGSEVVQCYVEPVSPRLVRPVKELKAFAKVRLEPGATGMAQLVLDDRSFSYWDPGQSEWDDIRARGFDMFGGSASPERRRAGWQLDAGDYIVHVGRASDDLAHSRLIHVVKD